MNIIRTKDSFDLLGFALLDERVKYNDMFSLLRLSDVLHRMKIGVGLPKEGQRNRRCCGNYVSSHRFRTGASKGI